MVTCARSRGDYWIVFSGGDVGRQFWFERATRGHDTEPRPWRKVRPRGYVKGAYRHTDGSGTFMPSLEAKRLEALYAQTAATVAGYPHLTPSGGRRW